MADDVISTTGKWVDSDGRVVDSEPVEGRVLVAPGTPITPDIRAAIERAEAEAPQAPVEESADADDAEDQAAGKGDKAQVETASKASAPETAAKTGRTGPARKS
jgi:hypothetical protein